MQMERTTNAISAPRLGNGLIYIFKVRAAGTRLYG